MLERLGSKASLDERSPGRYWSCSVLTVDNTSRNLILNYSAIPKKNVKNWDCYESRSFLAYTDMRMYKWHVAISQLHFIYIYIYIYDEIIHPNLNIPTFICKSIRFVSLHHTKNSTESSNTRIFL
jgi:hypothetical protein